MRTKARRDRAAERLRTAVERVQEMGCVVKDLDTGLVDFPTLYRGEEVYLCWRSAKSRSVSGTGRPRVSRDVSRSTRIFARTTAATPNSDRPMNHGDRETEIKLAIREIWDGAAFTARGGVSRVPPQGVRT